MVTWDSRGNVCFICDKKVDFIASDSSKYDNQGRITSFKMFLRYLGVDLFEHFSTGVNLCEWCSTRLNGFWELYQEFENLRLCLDDFVRSFHDRMKIASENILKEASQRDHFTDMSGLRNIVLRKCALKIGCIPFIKLERVNVPLPLEGTIEADIIAFPVLTSVSHHDIKIKAEINDDIEDYYEDNEIQIANHEQEAESLWEGKFNSNLKQLKTQKLKSTKSFQENPPSRNMFTCQICQKTFSKYETFLIHKTIHQRGSQYKCSFCPLTFIAPHSLRSHNVTQHLMEFHSSRIPPGVKQPELENTIKYLLAKKTHYSKHVGCPFCTRLFPYESRLRCHLNLQHFDKVILALKTPMDTLVNKTHAIRQKGGKKFIDLRKEDNLTLKPSGDAVSPYQCSHCKEVYQKVFDANRHSLLNHTFPYLKDKLPPVTTQEGLEASLNRFLDNCEAPEGVKSCPLCLKEFKRRDNVKEHLLVYHLDIIFQKEELQPSMSPLSSVSPLHLVPNIKKEELKQNFKCWSCGDKCDTKKKLADHMKLDHPGPLLECKYCEKGFSRKDYGLREHAMLAHTLKFFEQWLPTGTTVDVLEKAIVNEMCGWRAERKSWYKCSECVVRFHGKVRLRGHILNRHFSKILSAIS